MVEGSVYGVTLAFGDRVALATFSFALALLRERGGQKVANLGHVEAEAGTVGVFVNANLPLSKDLAKVGHNLRSEIRNVHGGVDVAHTKNIAGVALRETEGVMVIGLGGQWFIIVGKQERESLLEPRRETEFPRWRVRTNQYPGTNRA